MGLGEERYKLVKGTGEDRGDCGVLGYIMFLDRSRSPNDDTKILVLLYKCACFHVQAG